VLDVAQLKNKVPFIDKTDDLVGGLFGGQDGLVNPNRLKEHYREEAVASGAKFLDGVWVCGANAAVVQTSVQKNGSSPAPMTIRAFQFSSALSSEKKKQLLTENPETLTQEVGEWIEIRAQKVVNAAGAWAPHFAKILNYASPSVPVRRQISLFHARDLDLTPYGMMIDPSGVYFHPEAIYGLSGFANRDEPPGFDFRYDGEKFFQEYIWPALYERATAFESLKHVSGWSGLYENSPDHHAIVGAVKGQAQVYEAHSFSGRGAMQSYGAGLALAELIVKGRYETLDLAELAGDRFAGGRAIANETWVI
jgi:glycine/D-amino acid oxidase-like deaminating enzyme